jgi:hypothetical protein
MQNIIPAVLDFFIAFTSGGNIAFLLDDASFLSIKDDRVAGIGPF